MTALAARMTVVLVAPSALATTGVTVKDALGLAAVGPTGSAYGFPTWYSDKGDTRLEPCLDGDDPLCGFLPGDIPDATLPIAFPGNFPDEFFYFLASSTLTLPGGGRAVLTSGLEAAFLKWMGTDAPAGYLGGPAAGHTVTGGPVRNSLEMWNGTTQVAATDQFTLQGEVATHRGVTVDSAVVNGGFVDVVAASESSALQVDGQDGKFPTTVMRHDDRSTRFYARVPVTAGQSVTSVTVRNNQDNPPSTAAADVRAVTVTRATDDGSKLPGPP